MLLTVVPTTSFDHGGMRRVGVPFECAEVVAHELKKAGLVALQVHEPAKKAEPMDGNQPVSPAAPASQDKTLKPSRRGAKKKKTDS